MSDPNAAVLVELAEVKGQLKILLQLTQQNHEATHQRINDFRHAVEGRIDGVEERITGLEGRVKTVEQNERGTALRSAGASAVILGAVELLKFLAGRH
jgi:hypothetical protein